MIGADSFMLLQGVWPELHLNIKTAGKETLAV